MACSIIRNKQTNEIEQVLAPNGKESKLYKDILKINPDKEAALRSWAQVYTPSFKAWFGDWENNNAVINSKITLSKQFSDTYNIIYNDKIIGTIDIPSDLEGDTISIGDINIKPEFRGKGLGVETYKAAINIAGKPLESFMATDEANRVWSSLVKQGLAKKTNSGFITINQNNTSKVVDENGEPLLVYHGSDKKFDTFDTSRSGDKTGWAKDLPGIYFFNDIYAAEDYTVNADSGRRANMWDRMIQGGVDDEELKNDFPDVYEAYKNASEEEKSFLDIYEFGLDYLLKQIEKGDVIPSFLSIKNPTNFDSKGRRLVSQIKDIKEKVSNQNDGVIVENTLDRLNDSIGFEDTVYVAFEPNQIKSAFNQGTFSEKTGNIYNQLTSKELESANEDLNQYLVDFLKPFGVQVRDFEEYKNRTGQDGLGVTDVLNKLIYLSSQSKIDTMPEEAAHMAIMLMGEKHPDISFLLENIEWWSEYGSIKKEYSEKYKGNEKMIKIEAIAKLISGSIVKKYKETGGDKKLIEKALAFINSFLQKIREIFLKKNAFYSPMGYGVHLADKIAINMLAGNTNYVANLKNSKEALSYDEALKNNPFAKGIVDKYTTGKYQFKLVGSIAIAGQGENIYRPSEEPIHDIDFIVSSIEDYNDFVNDLANIGAEPVHNGWENKTKGYTTYAYYIPAQGHTIKIISRGKGGWVSEYKLFDPSGKEVKPNANNIMSVDFFTYYNKPFEESVGIFSSWQDIYNGKLGLSKAEGAERMFQREKDQRDYVLSQPVNRERQLEEFTYLQKEKQSPKESNEQIDNKIKNFLSSIGVNIQTLSQLRDRDGNLLNAIAKADMLNKIIQVIEGKADITTLSEEASHFFVEMLGTENALYKEMYNQITGYKIYKETVDQYKDIKMYRNADGTINFDKIKKEAIGKLIMAHIIKNETGEEVSDKINTVKKWWAKVWDFIKKVFNVATTNPFQTSAESITTGDISELDTQKQLSDEEFLQATTADSSTNKLIADQDRIKLDDSLDPVTGEKKHIYTVDGKPVLDADGKSRSVNSVYVDMWYKRRFPTDNRSERQRMIDSLKADEGTKIHLDMQDIIERYFDEKGNRRTVPVAKQNVSTNAATYSKLETYFNELIQQYKDPKTKFLSEVRIYDPEKNVAGTIDLVIILPDGSVDIYDWKSQEVGKNEDELKWFKAPAYRIQMEEYKKILSKHYGFSKFNKLRAIPIRTEYLYSREVGGLMIKNLKDIEIGNADPAKIPENKNYLLPVVMLYESTGNENLDSLITKLNAIYEILASKKVKPSEKNIKAQELNDLAVTIRDLQVRKNINSFVDNGLFEITKYKKKLDNNEFNISNIGEAIKTMRVYAQAQKYLQDQVVEINKQINSTTDANTKEYLKNLKEQFQDMIGNATYVLDKLIIRRKEIGDAYAKSQGINTLLKAEKSLDWLKRNFRSTSTLDTAAMQTFYKTLRRAQGIRDQNVLKTLEELKEIEKSYSEWAATNGKSGTDMFEYLLEFEDDGKWNGSFLNIYSKEFNKQKKIALKNSDFGWFKANTVFDQAAYTEARLEQIKLLEDRYPGTDEKIKKRRDKALLNWEEEHSSKSDFAYINKYNTFIEPDPKWYSDKYKFVYQKNGKGEYVNKPLKDAYEYFQKLTRRSAELAMIDRFSSKFIPSMLKGVEFNVGKILDDLQVHSDQGFSNIDELTGDLRKEIPVYYTKEIDDSARKSQDLFKVFGQYAVHLENYQAMSDIEDISDILLEIENEKQSYAENQFGKINKTKKINKNEINVEVLENHINYYLYGRETSSNIDKAIEINGTEYSAVKSVRKTLKYMALKTLGLNVLSGTATFVGGTANAFFVGSKRLVFTEGEWVQGILDYTSKDEITMAAIYQFGLTIEDETNKKLRDLSVDGVMKHANSDALMFIQRTGDKWATLPVSAAMLRTYMIGEDGKLVNIRKHVKSMNNYNNFYNLSMSEQKSLTAKMEAEVQDLMENKSLKATAKIENGKLVIPGMTGNTDNTIAFRGEVQKTIKQIIGNASRQDINQVRMSLAGSILMQFRSWMPQMMAERFGDLTYDMDMEAWQYGKARLFFKHLVDKNILPLIGELTVGFGTNTIEKAKERYTEFLIRLKEEGKITEDSEFMTEAEFIDMYLGNLRSMMRELIMWLGFASLCFWAAGGDDEDKSGARKWIAKALRKYKNEFAFYYSPGEFTSMLKSPIPIIGLLTDAEDLVTNTIGQGIGFMRGDTEQMDENHPLKYLNKILPITKELQSTYALFDDDFRKSFDIKD